MASMQVWGVSAAGSRRFPSAAIDIHETRVFTACDWDKITPHTCQVAPSLYMRFDFRLNLDATFDRSGQGGQLESVLFSSR
eukprot:scaffold382595_cov19-Prasinocladus_malaysianus.AAC.1